MYPCIVIVIVIVIAIAIVIVIAIAIAIAIVIVIAIATGVSKDSCPQGFPGSFVCFPRLDGSGLDWVRKGRTCGRGVPMAMAHMAMKMPAKRFAAAVVGDLHLSPKRMGLFHRGRKQLRDCLEQEKHAEGARTHVFQLGDLGAGDAQPGTEQCFQLARQFMEGFETEWTLVTGNHDLEGFQDFDTDEANLNGWKQVFEQEHHWVKDIGPAVCIGLSTTRFRDAEYSSHEVYVDESQRKWFLEQLHVYKDRPVFVFTHAPPLGSGIKVLDELHVKNRCAWLNHSDNPRQFIEIVARHPQIKLWFSGHFHLSHNYRESIGVYGNCAFVQVGVMGDCSRDGFRQSRMVAGDEDGYELYTVDHGSGEIRLDMRHEYADGLPVPNVLLPEEEILCDPSKGWLCAESSCLIEEDEAITHHWLDAGSNCLLSIQDNMVVEYDALTQAPVGIVCTDLGGRKVRWVDLNGRELPQESGYAAIALEVYDEDRVERVERNRSGGFCRVFQTNKYHRWLDTQKGDVNKKAKVGAS